MNKKRIAQMLTVLILLSNVNFQPNLIYADEVGNENVVSGSNLEEEEETGKEIELGTIDLDYYPNKYSQYSKRNYLSEAEKTVIKFGKEKLNKDFYISDALFENNKVCYKLILKNASDDYFPYGNNDSNSEYAKNNYRNYDFDKNDRNKYIVYINAPNNSAYFDPEDFNEHDYYNMNVDKIQNMIEKSLSQKFSNFNYNLKLNLEKQPEYKNGLKIVYASEGEDESGNVDGTLYKLYFKPLTLSKTLNEYIDETNAKPFFVSENEILENKISDENLNKINEILNNFNKNILFNVNLKIENQSIKKENISNNNIQYYINVKNEIDGTNKKLIISYTKEPELLETYNITEKINVNQNHNFNYYGFYFYQECVERMKRLTNEDNLIFNTLKFDKNKNLYYYDATKRLEGDSHSIDYQKLENLENRKKYRMYIDLHNFIYDKDFCDYNTIINYINNDILRTNYGFRNYYKKPFKTDNTKYKDGDYIYVILKDEYNKEYKLYTKQKELNEFIESNILISKEELENEEINKSIDSVKSELKEINESPFYIVNLEIKSNKIKNDNGKLYIEVLDKISNKTYKLHVNTYDEITIEIPYELRYKKYYEEGGEVYLRTLPEKKQDEINEKIKNILGENFVTYNRSYGGHTYIGFSENIKNGKPEYEASILYQTEDEPNEVVRDKPKKILKVKFITDEAYFLQNIYLQRDKEISKENEDLITNWYKNKMVNIKDFVFLSKIPKKENNQYYYEVKITDNEGIEKNTRLHIEQINGYEKTYFDLFSKDGEETNFDTRINFPSNRFNDNNLLLTDDEMNEIKSKFLKFQESIYYNIKSINVNKNVKKHNDRYWIQLDIEKENKDYEDEKVNVELPIYNEEKKEAFILFKRREKDLFKYYISKNGTYIYFGQKNDGIGIPLNEYVKNDLKENEKIEKIDFAKDENAIRYHITDDKNNERLIDIPLTNNIKLGTPKYLIELKDSVKETRDITEKDKEIISKIFKNKYRGLVKDIKFSDKIFGQDQSYGNNAYTFIEINPKDSEPLNIKPFDVYDNNGHHYYKVLLTSSDVDILCENICPPPMESNTEEPSLTCGCTKITPRPIKPEDFPDPEKPKYNEPTPKVTPSDLPKTTPSNIPKNQTPSTKTSTPPTVTNRTPITIIEPKPNEEINPIKNEEPVNNKPEVKSESRISRDIKTSDNLFILLSLFSGFFMLFYFSFIKINRKKEE